MASLEVKLPGCPVAANFEVLSGSLTSRQCFMQRPVHPSYGRGKQNMDGCLFVWTGKKKKNFFNSYVSRSPVRRTAQSALESALHVMLLSYYRHVCIS